MKQYLKLKDYPIRVRFILWMTRILTFKNQDYYLEINCKHICGE
jgi:hypothetical protein